MKDVFVEIPFAKIEFATETGQLSIYQKVQLSNTKMDLDIISINTDRDVGEGDSPTFSIVLIYRDDWYKRIGSNDLVKIVLGRGKDEKPVMFGMVDTVYKSWSFVDLKPVRTVTISGRGFNKALMQFGIGAVQEIDFSFQAVGFYEGQDAGYSQTTPARLIQTVFEYYLNKGININFANGKSFKSYIKTIFQENPKEEVTLGNVMGYYDYQGGLWEYIKELRNAPFYEVFWEITDDLPTFIVRPTPFNPENWNSLKMVTVDERHIIDEGLGRNDLETYTVYIVKGESIESVLDGIFGLPLWYEPFYDKYGLRRLQVQSKYMASQEAPSNDYVVFDEVRSGSGAGGTLARPVDQKYKITSKFGKRGKVTALDTGDHKGIDFAAPRGTEIYSAESGKIKYVGYDKYRGHYVDVQHDNGMVTRYQHCNVRPPLPVGTKVSRGQVIAQVGSSGDSTGNHLHFEVHIGGNPVDPEPYIGGGSSSGNKGSSGNIPVPITSVDWDNGNNERILKLIEENKFNETTINNLFEQYLLEKPTSAEMLKNAIENNTNVGLQDFLNFAAERIDSTSERNDEVYVSTKTIDLFNWNIKNNYMENGTINLKGGHYQVGTRLYMKSTDMEYYIEKVSHKFVYNENWTTDLEVTRGLQLGTRFDPPWDKWKILKAEDLERITGISQATMSKSSGSSSSSNSNTGSSSSGGSTGTVSGLQAKIRAAALAMQGLAYSQEYRMSDNYADCSSLVYRAIMEALGKSWKGTWAFTTRDMANSSMLKEIPLSEVQPWDVLWRSGHTEFLGDDGKTYGAHQPGVVAGPGGTYKSSQWTKAYRVVG